MPLLTSDPIIFGVLAIIVALVFYARTDARWARFYVFVPPVLLCYLLPAVLRTTGVITYEGSMLWPMAKDFLLPGSLVLLTLSIDLKAVFGLGYKALVMFFTATVGVIVGGPLAIMIVGSWHPDVVGGDGAEAVWRGLATLAGSWIGGGANQTAMLEIYGFNPERYGAMVAVDILVANLWMAVLLYGAGKAAQMDRWLGADSKPIDRLKQKMADYQQSSQRIASVEELMVIAALAFGGVGLAHLVAGFASEQVRAWLGSESVLAGHFFWVVVTATTVGLALSFTRVRHFEGAGASKVGTVFIFLLVAIIGTKMDLSQVTDIPWLFLVGLLWMLFHITLLLLVARWIRAPFFLVAVGSKANIGGAASAPIVAAAFHPSLAPVGVLLAVLGYAMGTYGAILCAELMRLVAP